MKKIKRFFKFTSSRIIEADNLEQAQDIFADEAAEFVADADIEIVFTQTKTKEEQ